MRYRSTAVAVAMLLTATGFAQQPSADPAKPDAVNKSSNIAGERAGFVQQQDRAEWRTSQLIAASVSGPDKKSVGSIDDVIIGSDGQVKAVVVGVGGFLGVGQKKVAVPFTSVRISRKPNATSIDRIKVSFSQEELKKAPRFAYYEAPTSGTAVSRANANDKGTTGAGPAR